MGQIVTLDQNMINMIAAGEVIERPASVVKELLENSIDAGATKITVSVEDGGRKSISVSDNGCGMDADDLAAAFEPHTTSKIKDVRDLQAISTLGFRGEALASIASVANVKAISRPVPSKVEGTKDSAEANYIEIDCGSKGSIGPASADYGTTIQIRDIFYKLPARRKFLKSPSTELEHITEHFIRIALANCSLDMTLCHNGRELYRLTSEHDLRRRLAALFSQELSQDLISAESKEKDLHIFALLGTPAASRTTNKFQYVFLNGRFIRDKFISHAIKEAYRGILEPNRFPVAFLFITMPCDGYDVNVHPTKIEVRFYNANLVHSQILGCLREKLLSSNLQTPVKLPQIPVGSPDILKDMAASIPQANRSIADAMAEFFQKHRPIHSQHQFTPFDRKYYDMQRFAPERPIGDQTGLPMQKQFMQVHNSFIVAEADDGFIVIDQHALHERIIYEQLCKRIKESKLESQRLLIPESFQLTDAAADAIKTNDELIEKLGIELVPFGPRTYAVQAFPALLVKVSPLDFVRDLLDLLAEKSGNLDEEGLLDEVLNMAACKAAIKAGQKLSDSEIEHLLADRETPDFINRCPHGRPAVIKFSMAELEKQFKRT